MNHAVYRVTKIAIIGPYTLRITFDDDSEREIDFQPVLAGELYGPLRDETMFNQVTIDPETATLVWPNGADFDPETLHNWPDYEATLREMALRWTAMMPDKNEEPSQSYTRENQS